MVTNNHKGLGWLPDVPSVKDYTLESPEIEKLIGQTKLKDSIKINPGVKKAKKKSVDLRPGFSPVENQEDLGSCTAQATVALAEYSERKALGKHIDASRLFLYKVTRNLMGETGDTGAFIRTAMGGLVLFGAPPERYWPYDGRPAESNTRFDQEPDAFCYAFASNFKAIKYFRLDPAGSMPEDILASVRLFLAAEFPSMFGIPVYDEVMYPNQLGGIAYPEKNSKYYGGHAIVAAGYDDNKKALLIRNSWGQSWGDQGYGWLDYEYIRQGLARDWWTITKQDWVETGRF